MCQVLVWAVESCEKVTVVATLTTHQDIVWTLDLTDSWLAAGSEDATVSVYPAAELGPGMGEPLYRLEGHQAAVTCVSVRAAVLVTGCRDGLVLVWQLGEAKPDLIARLVGHTQVLKQR